MHISKLTYNLPLFNPLALPILGIIRPDLNFTSEAYACGFSAIRTGRYMMTTKLVNAVKSLL